MKTPIFDKEWFTAQFGCRPTSKTEWDLKEQISSSERETENLKTELFELQRWDIQMSAALKTHINTIYNLKNKKLLK